MFSFWHVFAAMWLGIGVGAGITMMLLRDSTVEPIERMGVRPPDAED